MAMASTSTTRYGRQRDQRKSALYETESMMRNILDTAQGMTVELSNGIVLTPPTQYKFGDIPSVQRYVDRVLDDVRRTGDYNVPESITVRRSRGERRAFYSPGKAEIAMSGQWSMCEVVVLHEIAHALNDDPTCAHHGPEFLTILTDLFDRVVGPELTLLFRVLADQHGVRFNHG